MTAYQWKLAELFQSGMLFQQGKEMVLWGCAAPGSQVAASLARDPAHDLMPENADGSKDFCIAKGEATTAANGSFSLRLPPQTAGEGFTLIVSSDHPGDLPIVLEDVGFGDVYLAGGQSNMEFFLKYDRDWEHTQTLPRNPHIRMYNVPQRAFEGHTTRSTAGRGMWFDDRSDALATFSAPAYSFARNVQEKTGIPIGVIGCNWGGSTAAAWVPENALRTPPLTRYLTEYEEATADVPPEKLSADSLAAWAFEDSMQHGADFEPLLYGRDREWQIAYMKAHAGEPVVPMGPYHFCRPGGLYETMLKTLIPFALKGVLWYQGESDAGDRAPIYDKLLTELIRSWRDAWNEELPFFIVQLAPFGVWLDCDSTAYTIVREKQAYVAEHVPGVFMASIMDLGSYYDIHPKEKMEVGRRLALLARGHLYGEQELLCDAPKAIAAFVRADGRIAVTFLHADGLRLSEKPSDLWFETDGLRRKPKACAVEGEQLLLTPPDNFSEDTARSFVCLGYDDYAEIYLYNHAGLCAAPFRLPITSREEIIP